ncbi:MAG: heavy-metal-associated domain-containing protein [Mariniphaga sp.]
MKTRIIGIFIFLLAATTAVFAGEKTEKFEVKGNCSMCEKRIEKAALSVEGVTTADWSKETKQVEVTFNEEKTSADNVQEAIAAAGHDTKNYKAEDEVYDKLPACCQYDRTEAQTKIQGHETHGR